MLLLGFARTKDFSARRRLEGVMTASPKQLTDSLRFQLNLLRLAVVPHSCPRQGHGADAALELAELAKQIPARKGSRTRSRK